jgi:hypothetical protein
VTLEPAVVTLDDGREDPVDGFETESIMDAMNR